MPDGHCPELCPGCRYRKLSREESERRKLDWIDRCFAGAGIRVPPPALSAAPGRTATRRRALLHAARDASGWQLGLVRREGREFVLVPVPECPAHEPALNERLLVLRSLIPAGAPLRFVMASGPLLTLVLKCAPSGEWRLWGRSLEPALSPLGVQALFVNWHPAAGRARPLSSRHMERLFGPEFCTEGGLRFGPLSFRQQIPALAQEALLRAEAYFSAWPGLPVLDLYCGSGSGLSRWHRQRPGCVGVELGGEACRMAALNAPAARLLKGRVEDRIPQMEELLGSRPHLAYMNPPRDGLSRQVLQWILGRRPAAMAYLSCNPRSLAENLRQAVDQGYALDGLRAFDFFPGTDHVECLALLRDGNIPAPVQPQSALPMMPGCEEVPLRTS